MNHTECMTVIADECLLSTHLSALLEDLLGLHSEDGVEGVGEHVPRGERVLEERVGLPPLLARHSLEENNYGIKLVFN